MSTTDDITHRTKWVKISKYCAESGDTPGAVHARRRKGQWIDGVHTQIDPGGNCWVCPDEVDRWIEGTPTAQRQVAAA